MTGLGRAYLIRADVRGTLPLASGSVQTCVTSPPYWNLRDYNDPRQIGLEPTPAEYIARLVEVFREVRRVLRDDGTLWVNIGDSYCNAGTRNNGTGLDGKRRGGMADTDGTWEDATGTYRDIRHSLKGEGIKHKDLVGIPWMLAFALRADGWWLRSDTLWIKRNPMRESIRDRPTKAHEYVFLLSKSPTYFYDNHGERAPQVGEPHAPGNIDPGKIQGTPEHQGGNSQFRDSKDRVWGEGDGSNLLTWWDIPVRGYPGAHFATFPPELPTRCIRLGTSERGCCPACGAPWRRVLAKGRKATRPGLASKVYAEPPVHPDSPLRSHAGMICGNRDPARHVTVTRTAGWEPGCGCDAGEPVPCRVLDPFSGSGTTAAVARELGRVGIGLEVNADYLDLARDRVRRPAIGRDNPRLAGKPTLAPMANQLSIFDQPEPEIACSGSDLDASLLAERKRALALRPGGDLEGQGLMDFGAEESPR